MEHVSTQDSALSNLDDFNMNLFQGETAAIVKLNDVGVDKLMEILCYNRPISSGRIYIGEQQFYQEPNQHCGSEQQADLGSLGD